jgi:hypothetical protein
VDWRSDPFIGEVIRVENVQRIVDADEVEDAGQGVGIKYPPWLIRIGVNAD